MLNKKFSRLLVIARNGSNKHRESLWTCLCDCGATLDVPRQHLKSGNTRSCGCLQREEAKEKHTKHGLNGTPVHGAWRHMHDRCRTEKNKEFKNYGGRGISVCKEWSSFEVFFADMGHPPTPNHSLDRVENDSDYSKNNCRWATPTEQSMNRRVARLVSISGVTKPLTAWARELGLKPDTVFSRLAYGWTDYEALGIHKHKRARIENKILKSL